ncbi:hypothetical protein NDU88_004219 [Pleurodeles waltl]|uniref:Uncharacterized protein n=1 Tax=Pleurodeles waltl TaxID=8319 RepID=A0AAV7SIB8_PLEWA|nr:hypothetical protein NDU88_004219 [Pleurodeles waltl]
MPAAYHSHLSVPPHLFWALCSDSVSPAAPLRGQARQRPRSPTPTGGYFVEGTPAAYHSRHRDPCCASTGSGLIALAISCSPQRLFCRGDARSHPLPPWHSSSPLLGPVSRLHEPCCSSAGPGPTVPAISCSPRWLFCGGDARGPPFLLWRSFTSFQGPVKFP